MPTLQELREKRANAWSQAQEFKTRSDTGDAEKWTTEDEAAWARALDEVDTLGTQIENRERDEKLGKRFEEIDNDTIVVDPDAGDRNADQEKYRAAFQKWARVGMTSLEAEERQLLEANFSTNPDLKRAQGVATGIGGGYTVPEGFWAKVTETLKMFGGAQDGAELVTTDSGNPLPWPTNDDTANEGEQLGENLPAGEQDVTFGQKELGAYTYSSKMVKVSLQLIQDTGIDIEGFLARRLGERLGRIENKRFTNGNGATQPQGYITGATTGKTTAASGAITLNEIIDLIHSVDPAYRASGRCRFKLHDLILAFVRKIRDDSGGAGLGRPIWEPSVQVGVPDLLLGYPYTVNQDQDSTLETTKKTMAFGDFESAFVVRKVNGGQMMRLAERFAESLQVAFLGFERADSIVQDTSAVKLLVQV